MTATFKPIPTITLTSSPNPSVPNQAVVFTAAVTGPQGVNGTVAFKSDGALIAGCAAQPIGGNGQAQCVISTLAAGTRSITAEYSGGVNYAPGISPAYSHVVQSLVALNVTRAGPGTGTVTSDPAAINCGSSCTATFVPGTVVTLTASSGAGATFAGWTGDCSGTGTCTVTLSVTRNVTATFKSNAVLSIGSSVNPSVPNQAVTFTAQASGSSGTPTGTFTFRDGSAAIAGCSGVALSASGSAQCTTSSLAVGMRSIIADYSGDASYAAAATPTLSQVVQGPVILTITKAGTGSGTVTSSSTPLIDCGSVCSASFSVGITVTLVATPAPGSTFAGWSGACTGTADCQVLMSSAQSVTATFVQSALQLTVTRAGPGSGAIASSPAGIDCGLTCTASFNPGAAVTLTATPAADSVFAGWSGGGCSGTGQCVVTMSAATTVTATFDLATNLPRLVNISTRMQVLTGNDVMIAGFIIGGTAAKTVVVNVAGPSLANFGIANPLANPTLTLVRSADGAIIATNNNWQEAANAAQIQASGFAPNNPLEPAILMTLAPGAYTAIVQGAGGGTGVGLVGVFEVDRPDVPLINISTRGRVLTGNDVMIAGFIIQGTAAQTVVINVAGPSLTNFGIANPLANPTLALVRSADGAIIATNDDWQAAANAAQIQASGFAPNHPLEPAIMMTLPPGAYTAIVQGAGGTTGVGLVGVFKSP